MVGHIDTHIEPYRLSRGERSVLAAIQGHFSGPIIPSLLPVVQGNDVWRHFAAASLAEQRPKVLVFTCGKVPPELAFGITGPGFAFSVTARGLAGKIAHLASANYAVEHLKGEDGKPSVKVVFVIAHKCSSDVQDTMPCRAHVGTMPDGEVAVLHGLQKSSAHWLEGLQLIDIPNIPGRAEVPHGDWLHARASMKQIVEYSPPIREFTQSGKLIVVQAFYDNDTGQVTISSVLASKDQDKAVPADELTAIATGRYAGEVEKLHPVLFELEALMAGNKHFVRSSFRPAVTTDLVFLSCSDSRTSPGIVISGPNGMFEVIRNAGLMVNGAVIRSLTIAVEDALADKRARGLPEEVIVVPLGHLGCGAAKAALNRILDGGLDDSDSTNLSAPIIAKLTPRFQEYLETHPNYRETDPLLAEAATHNAVGAGFELLRGRGKFARRLRELMRQGKLQIIPGVYRLTDGMLQFLRPIPTPGEEEE